MKLIDYFFYVTVNFQVKVLKRDLDDSLWSASLHTGLWTACFLLFLITGLGLLFPNKIADFAISQEPWKITIIGLFITGLSILRYFKYVKFSELIKWRDNLSRLKRGIFYFAYLLFFLGTPIASFVTFRLYAFGQVKWW